MRYILQLFALLLLSNSLFGQEIIQKAAITSTLRFVGISKKLYDVKGAYKKEVSATFKVEQHEDAERIKPGENTDGNRLIKPDGALQKNYNFSNEKGHTSIKVLSNWNGNITSFTRSDNNIAVGPNHVVQVINSNATSSFIRVWNKAGEVLIEKEKFRSFIGIDDWGDPNIIYDEKADRFVVSFLYSGTDNKLIIIASQTADPTGAWFVYTFDTPNGFPDYEKLTVWRDSYIITIASVHPAVYALKRSDILNGIGASPVLLFRPGKLPTIGWQSLSSANETGAMNVPPNAPAVLMRVADDYWGLEIPKDRMEIFFLNADWSNPSASTFRGPLVLPIASYNSDLCGINANSCLPQKNADVKLWPVSNFIMDKAQYRRFNDHESIVCSHVCNADGNGVSGVRWYELRKKNVNADWSVYQQGTYLPTIDNRFMSSITINQDGTIAMGYNITSETIYPGIRITGRTACDNLNEMTVTETTVKEGLAPNLTLNYGDYNGIVTDPVDGSFWFTAQWNKIPWFSTNVVHFTIEPCKNASVKKPDNTPANYSNIKAFPLPADNGLTATFESNKDSRTQLQVYNFNGIKMIVQDITVTKGANNISINTTLLPDGYYLLKVATAQNNNLKFLVKHRH